MLAGRVLLFLATRNLDQVMMFCACLVMITWIEVANL